MRKIYSLVLMAMMLLVGTNAWASFTFTLGGEAQSAATLYEAFTTILNTPNAVAEIQLTSTETLSGTPSRLKFDDKQVITLDLNGFNLTDGLRIDVIDAKLNIVNNGANAASIDASNCNGDGAQPFNVYGVSQTDNTVARDASYLKIGQNVTVTCKSYAVAQMYYAAYAKNVASSHPHYSATVADGAPSYGATIDIYGEIIATEGTAIANNGTMNFKDGGDKTKCPIINIHSSARVIGADNLETIHGANTSGKAKSVYDYYVAKGENGEQDYKTTEAAVYGPGYGEWNIEGYLAGGVGLYLKAGKYNIANAKVYATATEYWEPIAYGDGFIGAGSAIVFDSHISYGGQIEMTIGGSETQVTSNTGYAIEDTKTTENPSTPETAVNAITINDGSFASNNGDVITTTEALQEKILENGSIHGGTYSDETIAEYIDVIAGALQETSTPGVYAVVAGCNVKLNAFGLATFSSNMKVVLPEGVTAWIATGDLDGNGNLNLSPAAETAGKILPANTGFILYGAANKLCNLIQSDENADAAVDGNLLKPATAWEAENFTEAYILHGNELWIYNGTTFNPGKAFLPMSAITLPSTTPAPQRIRMVFNQQENATAVENVEAESVKAVKFMGEDGQLYIRRGDVVYTVQGQVVK